MNILPNDIIRCCVSEEYLNPTERANLAACNKYLYYETLPQPLRIKIVSSSSSSVESSSSSGFGGGGGGGKSKAANNNVVVHSLQTEFFVSHVETPTKYILASENLKYGQSYYFWTFDYQRGNKVYLGRHTRHGGRGGGNGGGNQNQVVDENGQQPVMIRNNSIYTLGLRPREPNQVWEIMGGTNGDYVMWGEDIQLQVHGQNIKPRQPDSVHPSLLSCKQQPKHRRNHHHIFTSTTTQSDVKWCCVNNNNNNTKMQLVRCDDYIPKPNSTSKPLQVYAIPDASDEGEYLLINPNSYKDGSVVGCEGDHVIVDFHYWIDKGIMHLKASSLDFGLGIPILETDFNELLSSSSSMDDDDDDDDKTCSQPPCNNVINPLANLLDIRSARWGCVIYYMAVGADSKEGVKPDMNRFVNCVTDHSDHDVDYKQDEAMVYVKVKNKKVIDTDTTIRGSNNCATKKLLPTMLFQNQKDDYDPTRLWKFILSW